jgi:CHASE3 domain sensor protein
MTFTLTMQNFYLIVIFLLMGLQIYQFRLIYKLRKDHTTLWLQVQNFILAAANVVAQLEKKIDDKE